MAIVCTALATSPPVPVAKTVRRAGLGVLSSAYRRFFPVCQSGSTGTNVMEIEFTQ